MTIAAVLTGDLIGSTAAGGDALGIAMAELAAAAAEIATWQGGSDTRFTRYRGDGWQLVITDRPWLCLRAALCLAARLRAKGAPATRVAIGLGETGNLGGESLADASGPAFELSGKALEDMGRTHWLGLAGPAVTTSDAIITRLIEERARRWSPQQAEAVALALDPDNPTLADLATHLGISPQAVSYRLNGAGASAIRRALRDWEEEFEMQRLSALAPHLP